MEFHISRKARQRYQFAESLFLLYGQRGVLPIWRPAASSRVPHEPGPRRGKASLNAIVHAGQLYAMGLIDEASHVLMARYREQFDPEVMTAGLDWFAAQVGAEKLDAMLLAFVEQFPGSTVTRGLETPRQWLAGQTDGTPHRAAAFEELLLLWTANRNQAFRPFEELFEERKIAEKTVYREVTQRMPEYFASRPLIPLPDAKPMSLLDLLRAPAVGSPDSLSDQLALDTERLWKLAHRRQPRTPA